MSEKPESYDKIIEHLIERTKYFSEINNYNKSKPREVALSGKGQEIKKFIETGVFGCYSGHVAKLFSIQTEEEIIVKVEPDGSTCFTPVGNSVVVPLKNVGGHNYTIESPTINIGGGPRHFPCEDGSKIGNSIDSYINNNRPATEEEIISLVDRFIEAGEYDNFISTLGIIFL